MAGEQVFLSYIREDKANVDELQNVLEASGFTVWRDTKDLWPGDDWQLKIREAIQTGSMVFLACFSTALASRDTSYQFAELMIAADEYRLRPLDTSWLMTLRFDECDIPPVDLGGGRVLNKTIHRTDLFGEQKSAQLGRLVTAIHRVMEATPRSPSPVVLEAVAAASRADGNNLDRLRDLIRNPSLVMDYDDFLSSLRRPVLAHLGDRDRFPTSGSPGQLDVEVARAWIARMGDYETVIADLLEPLKLIATYGQPQHEAELTKTMRAFGQEAIQVSGLDLHRDAHEYPAVVLTYVCGLASASKRNYAMFRAATQDVVVNLPNTRAPFIASSGAASVIGDRSWLGSLLCQRDDGNDIDEELIQGLMTRRVGSRYTPISDHVYTLLAPLFRDDFVSDDDYADAFDRVEILLDAIGADARTQISSFHAGRGGYGRYTWRHRYSDVTPEQQMFDELQAAGAGWTPLLGGLFGGSIERATEALTVVVENAGYFRSRR